MIPSDNYFGILSVVLASIPLAFFLEIRPGIYVTFFFKFCSGIPLSFSKKILPGFPPEFFEE